MALFAVMLEMAGRKCLVVGGGPVAARKAGKALAADAFVVAVAPRFCQAFDELSARYGQRLECHIREYDAGEAAGYDMVFAASDCRDTNRRAASDAVAAGKWANNAGDPAGGGMVLPAVLERGGLTVAVASSGAAPALSSAVRDELAAVVTPWHAVLCQALGRIRTRLKTESGEGSELGGSFSRLCRRDAWSDLAGIDDADELTRRLWERLESGLSGMNAAPESFCGRPGGDTTSEKGLT